MLKINWSFLWEAFALASGVPPCTWRAGFDPKLATVQQDENQFRHRRGQQAGNGARVKDLRGEYRVFGVDDHKATAGRKSC